MDNTNSMGYVKLAAALVLTLLMAPSPTVAESDYLYQFNPDKYLHLGYNMNEPRAQSEGESLSGSETDSAQPASDDAGQVSAKELSQQSANPVGRDLQRRRFEHGGLPPCRQYHFPAHHTNPPLWQRR
jgi:hypothetical protein